MLLQAGEVNACDWILLPSERLEKRGAGVSEQKAEVIGQLSFDSYQLSFAGGKL